MVKTNLRFYTIPPTRVKWPWILVNMWNYKKELSRIGWFKHIILDSGVDKWFFCEKRGDYPVEYLDKYATEAQKFSQKYPKCFITIPDYPDDYEERQCWNGEKDNVEKTFENIERFGTVEGVNWIFPLQSRFMDLKSFKSSCKRLQEFDGVSIVGIGTVCKAPNLKFIYKCAKTARAYFPDAWIHAFGPSLKAIKFIAPYLDSFDSIAYFMKPNPKLLGKRMCSSVRERRRYFDYWVKRLSSILNEPTLYDFAGRCVKHVKACYGCGSKNDVRLVQIRHGWGRAGTSWEEKKWLCKGCRNFDTGCWRYPV